MEVRVVIKTLFWPGFAALLSPPPAGRFWMQIGVILASLLLLQCGGPKGENSETTAVQIKLVGTPGDQKTASTSTVTPDCHCLLSVTLDVTGPQMDAIHRRDTGFPGDDVVFELDVPNGAERRFVVRVVNTDQEIDLEGSGTRTLDGEPQVITIDLRPTPILSVNVIGNGRVVSTPAGIDCGHGLQSCAAPFSSFAPATLTAIPDPNASFIRWSSDPPVAECAGTRPSIDLNLTTANTNCAALFHPP